MKNFPYWLPLALYLVWEEAISTIRRYHDHNHELEMYNPNYHKSRGVIIGICCTLGQDADVYIN